MSSGGAHCYHSPKPCSVQPQNISFLPFQARNGALLVLDLLSISSSYSFRQCNSGKSSEATSNFRGTFHRNKRQTCSFGEQFQTADTFLCSHQPFQLTLAYQTGTKGITALNSGLRAGSCQPVHTQHPAELAPCRKQQEQGAQLHHSPSCWLLLACGAERHRAAVSYKQWSREGGRASFSRRSHPL